MSKRLATIDTAVPIEFDLDSVRAREPDPDALKQVYKELEFHSLLKELGPGRRHAQRGTTRRWSRLRQ